MGNIRRLLPDDLRDKLKEPIGLLVDEGELLKLLEKENFGIYLSEIFLIYFSGNLVIFYSI